MNKIEQIIMDAIGQEDDGQLQECLRLAYASPSGARALDLAQTTFETFTSRLWPAETTCRFLLGWRATHGTALFVGGLIIRILQQADNAPALAKGLFFRAASELSHVISEDMGVEDDVPHSQRFEVFASFIAGSDDWKLRRFEVAECEEFRRYVKMRRLKAPVEEGILTTAASENWNVGEYTFFASILENWVYKTLGHIGDATDALKYVTVHAGKTELGHFRHALSAWQIFCKASGCEQEPDKVRIACEEYLGKLCGAFEGLLQVLETPLTKSLIAGNAGLAKTRSNASRI